MNKKIILLLFLSLFLSGCSINVDLTITNKEIVKEEIKLIEDNLILQTINKNIELYLDETIDSNSSLDVSYEFDKIIENQYSGILVEKEYKSLDNYIESLAFKSVFSGAVIDRSNNYTYFSTSDNYFDNLFGTEEEIDPDSPIIETFNLNIKFYNEIMDSNADEVDEANNIYTWSFDKESEKQNLYFKISKKVRYDVLIRDFLSDNYIIIIIVTVLILSLTIFILNFLKKVKKRDCF